ncbi:MAG TPA: cob(I)yrinic acid a,c-diamide adenosyltransferase [Dehalococcoidia bacterium]|nr:cob(I)yrinic acid a,c-diamide adenosyltransferase [Dehalococcoidia bacterium]
MTTEKRKALAVLYTGNGKGKTTAALGMLLRAWGRGMKVCMLSFIKNENSNFGEERAARKMGVELIPLGGGFTWLSKDLEQDKALAQRCWALCKEKIASGDHDIVILDEITYPLTYGWLDIDEVIETLRDRPENLHVVLTGREAPQPLIDFADLVTEMREVKHPFTLGIKAQPGVDF